MKNNVIKIFTVFGLAILFLVVPRVVRADTACGTGTCPSGATSGYNNYSCGPSGHVPQGTICVETLTGSGVATCQMWNSIYCTLNGGSGVPPAGCTSATAVSVAGSPPWWECQTSYTTRYIGCCSAAPPPPPPCNPDCGNTGDHCSGTTYSDGCTDNACTGTKGPPTCSGASFPSCISPGSSFTVTANGVNNATLVKFPTWSSANGQDDIVWYTSGAPWQVSIPQSSHPGGDINVHVYMDNNCNTNVWCDGRSIPPCCTPTNGVCNAWSGWSCSGNSKTRSRTYTAPACGGSDVSCSPLTETVNCDDGNSCTADSCSGGSCVNTNVPVNGTWSGCSSCGRSCVGASCGGTCPGAAPSCAVDGVCNAWSGWSCSGNSKTRSRTYTAPACGGSDVSCSPLTETVNCDDGNSCTADSCSGGSCVNTNVPVNGVCGAAHYNCNVGTSTNNVDGASAWTWNCNGICAGTNPSCTENKPTAWCTVSPNPLPNSGNPGITLYSTYASYCYVEHDWSLVREGYFTSGTYYPGAQTVAGNHQGEVFCYNSNWNGSGWNTCNYTVDPPPSCTLTLTSTPPTISVSDTSGLTATTTQAYGIISKVDFSSNNGHVTINTPTDSTPANGFTSIMTGVSNGSSIITATATMSNTVITATCTGTSTVTVNDRSWWQVKDGDVTTNGSLNSTVPPTAGLYFDIIGAGGYPGIPAYGGTTGLTGANVSATGWLAASGYNATKIYNSAYFLNAIPTDTVINSLASTIDVSSLASGGTATNGIYWYEYDPASYGGADLTINNPTSTSLGARKVVLIVKGADVNLKGNINLTKGSGFFLLIAAKTAGGTKGNIIVDSGVGGGGSANLEGIYVADGQFQTGTTGSGADTQDAQLWIRGTVAAYGGVSLQRYLGAANSVTPAELFEYAPDLDLLFPGILGARTMNWQEVAP